nr:MAG TPA: hypothetical protein [Caudoviricetes sp.]
MFEKLLLQSDFLSMYLSTISTPLSSITVHHCLDLITQDYSQADC